MISAVFQNICSYAPTTALVISIWVPDLALERRVWLSGWCERLWTCRISTSSGHENLAVWKDRSSMKLPRSRRHSTIIRTSSRPLRRLGIQVDLYRGIDRITGVVIITIRATHDEDFAGPVHH